jgi:hypothetical protein
MLAVWGTMDSMLKVSLLCLLLSAAKSDDLEGQLLLFRKVNDELETQAVSLPPSNNDRVWRQRLRGSLADFSLSCASCPPGAHTSLTFSLESLTVLIVLADKVLSVIHVDGNSCKVAQVC